MGVARLVRLSSLALLLLLLPLPSGGSGIIPVRRATAVDCDLGAAADSVVLYVNWDNGSLSSNDYVLDSTDYNAGSDTTWRDVQFNAPATCTIGSTAGRGGSPALQVVSSGTDNERCWYEDAETSGGLTDYGTVAMWIDHVQATGGGGNQAIHSWDATQNGDISVAINSSGDIIFSVTGGSITASAALTAGNSAFFEFRFDARPAGGSQELYIIKDGSTIQSSTTETLTDAALGSYIIWGASQTASGYQNVDITIDDVLVTADITTDFYAHIVTNGCDDATAWGITGFP